MIRIRIGGLIMVFGILGFSLYGQLTPTMYWPFEVEEESSIEQRSRYARPASVDLKNKQAAVGKSFLDLSSLTEPFLIYDWRPEAQYSISIWVRYGIDETPSGVLYAQSAGNRDKDSYMCLMLNKDRSLSLSIRGQSGKIHNIITKPKSLLAEEWRHVAIVVDSSRIELYIQGQKLAYVDLPEQASHNYELPLSIGQRMTDKGVDMIFPGGIDDLRLYDAVLTIDEIKRLIKQSNVSAQDDFIDVQPKIAYYTLYLNNPDKVKHFEIESKEGALYRSEKGINDGKIDISSLTPGSYKIWLVNLEGQVIERHFVKM